MHVSPRMPSLCTVISQYQRRREPSKSVAAGQHGLRYKFPEAPGNSSNSGDNMRVTAGKHAIPSTRMRHGRRPIIAAAIDLSAAVAAVTLALTGIPGHVAAAPARKTAATATGFAPQR